jgi:cytochrome c1
LGWSEKAYGKALESLLIAGLILFDSLENTILITNWVTFNEPTNPKHAIGILAQLAQASSLSLKSQRFQEYKGVFHAKKYDTDGALRKAITVFSEAYGKAIATETEMESKTEREMETESRPDLDLDARNARAALRDCAVEGASLTPQGTGAVHLIEALERRKRA